MNTTGIFTTAYYKVACKPGRPFNIIPFGDVHRDSENCHEEKWLEFLEWSRGQKDAYFLGMGDYCDMASGSERSILSNEKLHENTRDTIQAMYKKNVEKLKKELGFMKGRLLGLIEGNHYGVFANGMTTTQMLCYELGCKYLGCCSIIRLGVFFGDGGSVKNSRHRALDICAHHGKGAAQMAGGSINAVQKMVDAVQADLYFMGHDHRKNVAMSSRLHLTMKSNQHVQGVELEERPVIYARTGSFLRGYVEGKASYVCDAMMSPSNLGIVHVTVTPYRKTNEQLKLKLEAHI